MARFAPCQLPNLLKPHYHTLPAAAAWLWSVCAGYIDASGVNAEQDEIVFDGFGTMVSKGVVEAGLSMCADRDALFRVGGK